MSDSGLTPSLCHDTNTTVLADRIKSRRLELGLTHEALAFRAGCSVATVQRAEAGRFPPSLRTLEKIATALGTTAGALLVEAEEATA